MAAPAVAGGNGGNSPPANIVGAPSIEEEDEFHVPNLGVDDVISMPGQSELSGSQTSGSQVAPGAVREGRRRSSAAASSTGAATPYAGQRSKTPTPTGYITPMASPRLAPPEPPTPPRPAMLLDVGPEVPHFDIHGGSIRTPTEAIDEKVASPDRAIRVEDDDTGRSRKIAQPPADPPSPERRTPQHPRPAMDVQEGS